jgi:hypothetical protein
MYNTLMTREAAIAHLVDLRRQADDRRLAAQARRERREAIADGLGVATPSRSAKSAVGWWLVATGIRLAGRPLSEPLSR